MTAGGAAGAGSPGVVERLQGTDRKGKEVPVARWVLLPVCVRGVWGATLRITTTTAQRSKSVAGKLVCWAGGHSV
jgi:hypothetical protein